MYVFSFHISNYSFLVTIICETPLLYISYVESTPGTFFKTMFNLSLPSNTDIFVKFSGILAIIILHSVYVIKFGQLSQELSSFQDYLNQNEISICKENMKKMMKKSVKYIIIYMILSILSIYLAGLGLILKLKSAIDISLSSIHLTNIGLTLITFWLNGPLYFFGLIYLEITNLLIVWCKNIQVQNTVG